MALHGSCEPWAYGILFRKSKMSWLSMSSAANQSFCSWWDRRACWNVWKLQYTKMHKAALQVDKHTFLDIEMVHWLLFWTTNLKDKVSWGANICRLMLYRHFKAAEHPAVVNQLKVTFWMDFYNKAVRTWCLMFKLLMGQHSRDIVHLHTNAALISLTATTSYGVQVKVITIKAWAAPTKQSYMVS